MKHKIGQKIFFTTCQGGEETIEEGVIEKIIIEKDKTSYGLEDMSEVFEGKIHLTFEKAREQLLKETEAEYKADVKRIKKLSE